MIGVFAGTRDGRDWVNEQLSCGKRLVVSVATEYGASLYSPHENLRVVHGRKDLGCMKTFLKDCKVSEVVDITHPYAVEVSENIRSACRSLEIPYKRILRERSLGEAQEDGIRFFDSYSALADHLEGTDGNILWTIGSKELSLALRENLIKRSYVRVLPTSSVLEKCEGMGLCPGQILALQGPFSAKMNKIIYEDYKIRHLVTKDSGKTGGTMEKILPAMDMGIEVLVYKRPAE